MSEYVKNIKEIKTELRAKYRAFRETLSPQKKRLKDASIRFNVLRMPEYQKNRTIFLYASKSIEVDTWKLLYAALEDGKRVALPRCVPETREMDFYYIRGEQDIEKGTFGVLEPNPDRCEKVLDLCRGLCIVPGMAFDGKGFRLGYGMGYYDRFLSRFQGCTVGICYADCIQWELPHGYYDRPVHVVVTENYIRRMSRPPAGDRMGREESYERRRTAKYRQRIIR